MSEVTGVEWKETQVHEVIGDAAHDAFQKWRHQSGLQEVPTVRAFVWWLLFTTDGDMARRRINDFPRQLFLPFGDEDRPWELLKDVSVRGSTAQT